MGIGQPSQAETQAGDETKLTVTGRNDDLVCVTPGTLFRSVPGGESVRVPDQQELANASSILLLSRLEAVLSALVEWAGQTGGWEAPCWRDAEDLLRLLGSIRTIR